LFDWPKPTVGCSANGRRRLTLLDMNAVIGSQFYAINCLEHNYRSTLEERDMRKTLK